jgi:hypothetical protein
MGQIIVTANIPAALESGSPKCGIHNRRENYSRFRIRKLHYRPVYRYGNYRSLQSLHNPT